MKEVNIEISGGIGCGKSIIMREISKMMFYKFGVDVKSPQLYEELIGNDLDNPEDWQLDAIKSTLWTMGESSINSITKKPCTKAEFVKCEFNHAWEAVKSFEDGEELYTKRSHKDFVLIDNAPDVLRFLYDLHRKVEAEIDERQEFIDTYVSLRHEFHGQRTYDDFSGFMFDSGKFKLVEV